MKAKPATPSDFVNWFEIPAYDLGRAKAFYDHLYGIKMETSVAADYAMAFFPSDKGIGGAIVQGPGCLPNDSGTLVYLNAGNDLDGMLSRVEVVGGRVIMGRSLISESAGWFALFIDSEGNRLALHAPAEASVAGTGKAPSKVAKAAPRNAARSGNATAKKKAKKTAASRKSSTNN